MYKPRVAMLNNINVTYPRWITLRENIARGNDSLV